MANERWPIVSVTGSEVIPTTDGDYFTEEMATSQVNNCQVYVEFFSDAAGANRVYPSAGTVSCFGRPMSSNYLAAGSGAVIDASTVTATSTYTPAQFLGRMTKGKVTLSGIVGAAYARIIYWRY